MHKEKLRKFKFKRFIFKRVHRHCSLTSILLTEFFVIILLLVTQRYPYVSSTPRTEFKMSSEPSNLQFPNFESFPTSQSRPSGQFVHQLGVGIHIPILTVITVLHDHQIGSFSPTISFMLAQSLKIFRWVIILGHNIDIKKYEVLRHIKQVDPRIVLLNTTGVDGIYNPRETGFSFVRKYHTKYVCFLDVGDEMELTAYEKLVWGLESNKKVAMISGYSISYGDDNFTWPHGFHDGRNNLKRNYVSMSVVMRSSSIFSTPCTFQKEFFNGYGDWDFELCLASNGLWGITIPEFLHWKRRDKFSLRREGLTREFDETQPEIQRIQNKYSWLRNSFPQADLEKTKPSGTINYEPPFKNNLVRRKSVLLIVSWMEEDGSSEPFLSILKEFSQRGFPVTVLFTLRKSVDGSASFWKFLKISHDLFVLPSFLELEDIPRFLIYIIRSRAIMKVVVSHSVLGYGLLPIIKEYFPTIPVLDIVMQSDSESVNEPFVYMSREYSSAIDYTIAGSKSLRHSLIQKGHRAWRVTSSNLIHGLKTIQPLSAEKRSSERRKKGIPPDSVVSVFYVHNGISGLVQKVYEEVSKIVSTLESSGQTQIVFMFVLQSGEVDIDFSLHKRNGARIHLVIRKQLDDEDRIKYLQVSDLLCVLSDHLISKHFVMTATSLGVVPLVLAGGTNKNIIPHIGNLGIVRLVHPMGDLTAKLFANDLIELAQNTKLRLKMSEKGRISFMRKINLEKTVKKTVGQIIRSRKAFTTPQFFSNAKICTQDAMMKIFNFVGHESDLAVLYDQLQATST